MAENDSQATVWVAIARNLAIAVTKATFAALTGWSALFAEAAVAFAGKGLLACRLTQEACRLGRRSDLAPVPQADSRSTKSVSALSAPSQRARTFPMHPQAATPPPMPSEAATCRRELIDRHPS